MPLFFLNLRRWHGSCPVDVECPRAQLGAELENAQAVEFRDPCTSVDVPPILGPLHLHDGAVPGYERSHALNGASMAVMLRAFVIRESEQSDVQLVSAPEQLQRIWSSAGME